MKNWYTSKMLWVNVVAIIAIVAQGVLGYIISPALQLAILGIINLILRGITKTEIVWGVKK